MTRSHGIDRTASFRARAPGGDAQPMGCVVLLMLCLITTALGGCKSDARDGAGANSGSRNDRPARLRVPQHTGARAGHIPAHVAFVEIDGKRHAMGAQSRTFTLGQGQRSVVLHYERCLHAPSPLAGRAGASRDLELLRAEVTFAVEPGAAYVVGCTPGGAGPAPVNLHWVDRKMPDGSWQRVAESAGAAAGQDGAPRVEIRDATSLDRSELDQPPPQIDPEKIKP